MTYNVLSGTLNSTIYIYIELLSSCVQWFRSLPFAR